MSNSHPQCSPATIWALPLAVLAFVTVAALEFRGLPAQVPVHFNAAGTADRWLSPKHFIALIIGLTGSLAALLGFARWITMQPHYDPDGNYSRHPRLRGRILVVLDLAGAGGIALVAWTAHLCVQASRLPEPQLNRLALVLPLTVLIGGAAAGAWWVQRAKRGSP